MRIPGMALITISFIPWIIYWSTCGSGFRVGILLSLVIIFIIVVLQRVWRIQNFIDLTTLLYFSIASLCTFILNLEFFMQYCGFAGYLTLFLMAFISIVVKRPFTLIVAKRDWPESYWSDEVFLFINYVISAVWALIFLTNSIFFLLTTALYSIILSNILIAFGIFFSIIFPIKAPEHYVKEKYVKPFEKFDWNVNVDPQRARGENEYDVIIVGAGIGGLTCGALLSVRGYRVLVLEQHYQVGGYCSSFKRGEFIFNAGVEDVSGLWEKGPIHILLRELKLDKEQLFVKNSVRYIFHGRQIDVKNLDDYIRFLLEMFPQEKEKIKSFFEDAKKAYMECYSDVEIWGTPLPPELIAKLFGVNKLVNYPREHPHFYDWMNKTYKQKLDEYFSDENLKKFLSALIGYVGTSPEKTPASTALTACVSYYLYGGYFPKGGAQKYADTLRDVILKHGGEVLPRHRVDKIIVDAGQVRGVRVGDKVFYSLIVVSNVNAKTTFLELVGEENLDQEFVKYIKELKMSPSCFMVFLGVDLDLSSYPTLIKNLDEGYEIVINSNADPSLAPNGKASITILTIANYYDFPPRGTKEYLTMKKEFAEKLIQKATKIIPNLDKHIIIQDAATPRTFERYTSMPEGAIYCFDQSVDTKRPYFKTPVRGLYLVGASTFPGAGIEATTISGMICANDIHSWKK